MRSTPSVPPIDLDDVTAAAEEALGAAPELSMPTLPFPS